MSCYGWVSERGRRCAWVLARAHFVLVADAVRAASAAAQHDESFIMTLVGLVG